MDYIVFVAVAPVAVCLLILAVHTVWPYRRKLISRALLGYLIAVTCFLLGNMLELFSKSENASIFWVQIAHVFYPLIAITWFIFALAYAGFEHLVASRKPYLLFILPAISVLLVFTHPFHTFFWQELHFFYGGPFLTVRGSYGPWFWISGVYVYILLVSGAVLIIGSWGGGKALYRNQSSAVVLGSLIPIALNLVYTFEFLPWLRKDFTPIGFALSGFAFFIGIHRFGLLRITPIAHRLVLRDIASGVLVIDLDDNIIDCNEATELILQVNHSLIIGTPWHENREIRQFLEGVPLRERYNFETSLLQRDGTELSLEVWICPIQEQTGKTVGTIVTIHDITERVRLSEQWRTALLELEERNERVQDLQLTLMRQDKLATMGQLTAGMLHDLNNPLTFLQSGFLALDRYLSEVLPLVPPGAMAEEERTEIEEERQIISRDFEQGFSRIRESLQSLLRLSRPLPDQEPEESDLNELIEATLELAAPALRGKLDVHKEYDRPLPGILCFPGEISNVILNLLLNALHAVEEVYRAGGSYPGTLRIHTSTTDQGMVRCSFRDSGPGIAENLREKVFEPFFTTKETGKGTGLGLSIARDVVTRRHGGALYITPGPITTFVMELPRAAL
ncbi:PAS domain S-box-containing protein [Alkalispirochaeta americana]|uniref:histidine kinase n=1 Tax=Alkalispirochaeta americana TaxID=159291 RepID=A0A1N6UX56_9SPIO|nr:histidine kinase N-terminal 7TM domain-containing protein [Alkalispirochaeta americana]SIQ69856.1 PAS domain S-box-containing protein [Alkalispirochaeta americana]